MIIVYPIAAISYLLIGANFWRKIIMPELSSYRIGELSEEEFWELIHFRLQLEGDKKNGLSSYWVTKGTFVLLWPIAILYGTITARKGNR